MTSPATTWSSQAPRPGRTRILCDEQTVHVSYCHNPFRYAWNDRESTLSRRRDPITRAFLGGAFRRWRQWDWIAAQRTSRYIANSQTTQARIRAYFGRESRVVHPPVDSSRFAPGSVGDYYATVSELIAHKQLDVAIEAFNRLGRPLLVVGDGPAYRRLKHLAGRSVTFTGRLSDAEVAHVLQGARALVLASVEEFGIAAVEAQAAGRPVIARRGGGALETVVAQVTSCFWEGGPAELAHAVRRFDDGAVDPQACVRNAARFDVASFRRGIEAEIETALSEQARMPVVGRQPLVTTRLARLAVRAAAKSR